MKTANYITNMEQNSLPRLDKIRVAFRIGLGVYFIYMGLTKWIAIEGFMSALNGYGIPSPLPLNLIAIFIPAIEIICGLALMNRRFWRSSMSILIPLMIIFTVLILWRMNSIHTLTDIPRCSITFDCGCGNGIINACSKIVTNSLILILMGILVGIGLKK